MDPILEALSMLIPYDIDIPKVRIGPLGDGGYVLARDITPDHTVVSYGMTSVYSFDQEMAQRGHSVYVFDNTISGINTESPNLKWFQQGITAFSKPEKNLFSIEDHLKIHNIKSNRLILKIDVEGAEFDALGNCPQHVLERFSQIIIEIHSLECLNDFVFRENYMKMFSNINNLFTLFHVHCNNYDGLNGITVLNGFPIVNILELSYIKTSTVKRSSSRTLYPTALDYPNTYRRDKTLWFFPFLPTRTSLQEFNLCHSRIELIEQLRILSSEPPTNS